MSAAEEFFTDEPTIEQELAHAAAQMQYHYNQIWVHRAALNEWEAQWKVLAQHKQIRDTPKNVLTQD